MHALTSGRAAAMLVAAVLSGLIGPIYSAQHKQLLYIRKVSLGSF